MTYTADQIRTAFEGWTDVIDFLESQYDLYTTHAPSGHRWDEILKVESISGDSIEFRVLDRDGDRDYRVVPLSVLLDENEMLKHAEEKRIAQEKAAREARKVAEAKEKEQRAINERREYERLKKKFGDRNALGPGMGNRHPYGGRN